MKIVYLQYFIEKLPILVQPKISHSTQVWLPTPVGDGQNSTRWRLARLAPNLP
jgi:hypothetical protein